MLYMYTCINIYIYISALRFRHQRNTSQFVDMSKLPPFVQTLCHTPVLAQGLYFVRRLSAPTMNVVT